MGISPRVAGGASYAIRTNPTLHALRTETAELLARALATTKPEALASAMNVVRTLVVRWMDVREVDRRPAPLAMLLALDDDNFERVVDALQAARAASMRGEPR